MTGGTEKYFRDLSAILENRGHEVIYFSLKHPDNPYTPFEKYFLENIDYRVHSKMYKIRNIARIIGRTIYSFEAKRKIEALIRDTKPDIAHIQSIEHHISPSILHSFTNNNIPVIQSVNTYKMVCASYRLYLLEKNAICTSCLYGKHYHAPLKRCIKGSLSASTLGMIEMYIHGLMKIYHLIDRFIVPNRFMEEKLIGAGYPGRKIVRLLNPLYLEEYNPSYDFDDYILYFGRIDPEKGVMDLVKAMKLVPKARLIVIGSGTEVPNITRWIKDHAVNNVEFIGPKWGSDLLPYLSRARLVVVPSIWHEPSPMVIYQSLATGKPVIGANTGGIPDLITEETGLLFEPGNIDDLARKIESLVFDDNRLRHMGRAARQWAEANLHSDRYYASLMQLYADAMQEKYQ